MKQLAPNSNHAKSSKRCSVAWTGWLFDLRAIASCEALTQFRSTFVVLALAALCSVGCGTTQSRALTEQLLVSDAVDRAIQQIDFSDLADRKVYLDDQFLIPIKGPGFVNAEYVESSLRQHLVASGCLLQDTKENAEIVVEARLGAMGSDAHEVVYGIPQNNALTNAASLFANAPPVPMIPEISAGKMSIGYGAAKVAVFAYTQEDRVPLWQSGVLVGRSNSRDVWMLGAGPIQSGTIYSSTRFAGQRLAWLPRSRRPAPPKLSPVPYMAEAHFENGVERLARLDAQAAAAHAAEAETAAAEAAASAEVAQNPAPAGEGAPPAANPPSSAATASPVPADPNSPAPQSAAPNADSLAPSSSYGPPPAGWNLQPLPPNIPQNPTDLPFAPIEIR